MFHYVTVDQYVFRTVADFHQWNLGLVFEVSLNEIFYGGVPSEHLPEMFQTFLYPNCISHKSGNTLEVNFSPGLVWLEFQCKRGEPAKSTEKHRRTKLTLKNRTVLTFDSSAGITLEVLTKTTRLLWQDSSGSESVRLLARQAGNTSPGRKSV